MCFYLFSRQTMLCSCCKQQISSQQFYPNAVSSTKGWTISRTIPCDQEPKQSNLRLSNAAEMTSNWDGERHTLRITNSTDYPRGANHSQINRFVGPVIKENNNTHSAGECSYRWEESNKCCIQMNQNTGYQNNPKDYSNSVSCKRSRNFEPTIHESQNITKSRDQVKRKPNLLETQSESDTFSPDFSQEGLRIIGIQIKRLRGISAQLRRCSASSEILFEILGKCVSPMEPFTNIPGFYFVLGEIHSSFRGATVDCAFYNFDELPVEVQMGTIYR